MSKRFETNVSPMIIRQKRILLEDQLPQYTNRSIFRADQMMKNLAIASALILCAVTLRTGSFPRLEPAADVVLAAATDQSLLDDQLGKLSFVSALFPETVLVFGEDPSLQLTYPVDAKQISHVWSEQEPYISWETGGGVITASADGEVVGIYHGNSAERIVKVASAGGLSCLYGNLAEVSVRVGDTVSAGDSIGRLIPGEAVAFEVHRYGISVDPAAYFSK